jgi:hypothetical protein
MWLAHNHLYPLKNSIHVLGPLNRGLEVLQDVIENLGIIPLLPIILILLVARFRRVGKKSADVAEWVLTRLKCTKMALGPCSRQVNEITGCLWGIKIVDCLTLVVLVRDWRISIDEGGTYLTTYPPSDQFLCFCFCILFFCGLCRFFRFRWLPVLFWLSSMPCLGYCFHAAKLLDLWY